MPELFKNPCWQILYHLRDVLKINICVVAVDGQIMVAPDKERWGGRFLTDPHLRFDPPLGLDYFRMFRPYGRYLETVRRYDLSCFAAPIHWDTITVGHIILGPVILTQRVEPEIYRRMAETSGADLNLLLQEMNTIRTVSHLMINSILELIDCIMQNNIRLIQQAEQLIDADEKILGQILKMIVQMTGAESGSLMLADHNGEELTVKAATGYGYSSNIIGQKTKIGESLSGFVARDKKTLTLSPGKIDHRVAHFLKRKEIKHAVIEPIIKNQQIRGVLNLHTRNINNPIEKNLDLIHTASHLLAF
ncbi:MAG: PocR ligand-binding domain-containing protein [Candidatus Omnitrophica bacterium]|nr:PocR ligand-binding domain-containing protein [Candidatus Omnitrophota bacterium]